jgi:hypothetical protein
MMKPGSGPHYYEEGCSWEVIIMATGLETLKLLLAGMLVRESSIPVPVKSLAIFLEITRSNSA